MNKEFEFLPNCFYDKDFRFQQKLDKDLQKLDKDLIKCTICEIR